MVEAILGCPGVVSADQRVKYRIRIITVTTITNRAIRSQRGIYIQPSPNLGFECGSGSAISRVVPTPDYDTEDETWEFRPGSVVRCEKRQGSSGEYLLAVRA
jgi:hypothetical protein